MPEEFNYKPSLLEDDYKHELKITATNMAFFADSYFNTIDTDYSGDLSREELENSAQSARLPSQRALSQKLLEHYDEAKGMATSGEPENFKTNARGHDLYARQFGDDNAEGISYKDVKAMKYVSDPLTPEEQFRKALFHVSLAPIFGNGRTKPGELERVSDRLARSQVSGSLQFEAEAQKRRDMLNSWFVRDSEK